MDTVPVTSPVIHATLNFAADRTDGGIWSNTDPGAITQALEACEVDIHDANTLAVPPTLDVEGFIRTDAPVEGGYHWSDDEWVQRVYLPHAVELVRTVTGAAAAAILHPSVLVRDTGDPRRAPAAQFVHLDQSRDSARPFLDAAFDQATRARHPRTKIFNVWRALTPPPQDVPLALCDQRTVDESDWVVGRTLVPGMEGGVAYVTAVPAPGRRWFFFSDLTCDEAIVFKGYDSDPAAPMGCFHGAFRRPDIIDGVPRASAETRVIALFDA